MSSQHLWERALDRYADSLYRLALLRDPDPARAAQATSAAFEHIDWTTATLDDQLEARLVAVLPPLRRRIGLQLRPIRRWPLPLPPAFWRLPPPARLALGMRLWRGYTTASIALALNQPIDDIRLMLCDAIARLSGYDPATIDPACRHSRALRLDEPAMERMHVLGCDACRIAVPRGDAAEQSLADTLGRASSSLTLPRETFEGIVLRLRAATTPTSTPAHNPVLLRTATIVLAVLVILALLIMPRDQKQTAAPPNVSARTVIQQALDQYGAAPAGRGVLHQHIILVVDEPHIRYEADVWTDAAQPARHRMQLVTGKTVQEWQSGDGVRAWRYFTQPGERYCGLPSTDRTAATGRISRWSIQGDAQTMLRAARWQTGPWTVGRVLMEQALAAPTVRSLGTVTEGEETILTLAAEGGIINGTMLLRLDGATSSLREIRQLTANNGQTQAETRWKLVSQERITSDAAVRTGVFTNYPTKQQPRELNRPGTIIDPACPLGGQENTGSIVKALGSGWPQLVGFRTPPADLDRAYLSAAPMDANDNSPLTYDPDSLALVYLGAGKRLVLRPRPLFLLVDEAPPRLPADPRMVAGEWQLQLDAMDLGRLSGTASPLKPPTSTATMQLQWDFFAEGLTYEQLSTLLSDVHILRIHDWLDHQMLYFDPEPMAPEVLDLLVPAVRTFEPTMDRTDHFVLEREIRQEPGFAGLEDPYHLLPPTGRSETWVDYGDGGRWKHFRNDTWHPNGQRIRIDWGDSQRTQYYDVRANVIRDSLADLTGTKSAWISQELVRPLFQYNDFKVIARDEATATLASTLPIAETDYQWALQVQQPPLSYWSNWPSFAGTIPQSITFSIQFDTVRDLARELAVTIPGPNGPIVLQRTTLITAEIGTDPPPDGWEYVPPAGTTRIAPEELSSSLPGASQDRIATTRLQDVVGMSTVRLWGWPEDHIVRFGDAYVPTVMRSIPRDYDTIELAVPSGFAVELHYYQERSDPINLLQGPADVLRLMLQRTPAAWTSSEERVLPIAGRRRPVWIMSAEGRHWAIIQLDQTLIVLDYRGERFEEMVLPALADIEPLD